MPDMAEGFERGHDSLQLITQDIDLTRFGCLLVSAHSDIGSCKAQEDRFIIAPKLLDNGHSVAFFGVFDGTVGDFASDIIHRIIVKHLVSTEGWKSMLGALQNCEDDGATIPGLAALAISQMYKNADAELLELCEKHCINYSSCTSVTVLLIDDYAVVAHLGDSRVALLFEENGGLFSKFITTDHKPNNPEERSRILNAGGSVQYLHTHSNKPFLRGGDFLHRKAMGDKPMQIQYSRAFGGKDLKMYGLLGEPDITVFRRGKNHKGLMLASDGLWDTRECQHAFSAALYAREKGENPSRYLVDTTLKEQEYMARRSDNITVIIVFFD